MARHSSTYRGARRNAARGTTWLGGGVQLDPELYKPTTFYATKSQPRTPLMVKLGQFWKMVWDGKRTSKAPI